MTRRVVLLRDDVSPLWFIRCEKPCKPDGWCQREGLPHGTPGICWLGGYGTRETAARMAETFGYEVVR